MMAWARAVGQTWLGLGVLMAFAAGCSHEREKIPCDADACDGSSQYCVLSTVEGQDLATGACVDLPSDYDPNTCAGLCGGGDSVASCMCNDDGCSVLCQSP